MTYPKVGIAIVNHDQKELLRACLQSWQACDYPSLELLVSDNNSTDGTLDMLRQDFPTVKVLSHVPEIGFAAAGSAGLRALAAGNEYLVLTTNDTLIEPDMLKHLVEAAQADPQAGVVGPKILFESQRDQIWFGGGYFHPFWGHAYHAGLKEKDSPVAGSQALPCHFISGCCFLTPSAVAQKLNYLRDELAFVFEDTDYCARAREAGLKVLYVPAARMYHRISATLGSDSPLVSYYSTRNGLAQVWRHRDGAWPFSALFYTAFMLPRYALGTFKRKGWSAWKNLRAMALGEVDFVLGNYGMRDSQDPGKPFGQN